jgi:hypothetical protein
MTHPAGDPITALEVLLGQLDRPAPSEPHSPSEPHPDPAPVYPNVGAFMDDYLARIVERQVAKGVRSGIYWCPQWWAHPEALSRVYALWRAWETLRVSDPNTGMSIWWRDHLDPHLGALAADHGPFTRCSPDRHYDPTPLPTTPVPPEVLAVLPDTDE